MFLKKALIVDKDFIKKLKQSREIKLKVKTSLFLSQKTKHLNRNLPNENVFTILNAFLSLDT